MSSFFKKRKFSDLEFEHTNTAFSNLSLNPGSSIIHDSLLVMESKRKKKGKNCNSEYSISMSTDNKSNRMIVDDDISVNSIDMESDFEDNCEFNIDKMFIKTSALCFERLSIVIFDKVFESYANRNKAIFPYFYYKCLEEYTLYRVFKMFFITCFIDSYKNDYEITDYNDIHSILNNKIYLNDEPRSVYRISVDSRKADFIYDCFNNQKAKQTVNKKLSIKPKELQDQDNYCADLSSNENLMDLD